MVSKEFMKKLLDRFNPDLCGYGFKGKADSQGVEFIRKTELGAESITIAASNYSPLYKAGMVISVGFNDIYRIEHYISQTEPKYLKVPVTINLHLDQFLGTKSYRYEMQTENDIECFYKLAIDFLNKAGFHFFQKYLTLESIDELMNADPYSDPDEAGVIHVRSKRGIIVAKLVNNPNFDTLVTAYRDRLQRGPLYLRKFEECVKFIMEHTLDELKEISNRKPGTREK
jgi:hypothetical protein